MRLSSLFVLFCLLISCDNPTNQSIKKINNFEREQDLIGEEILTDVYDIVQLSVVDSFLIAETSGSGYNFKIFSSKGLDFLGHIGEERNSPYGWGATRLSDQLVKKNDGICLWVNDGHKYNFKLVNINQSLIQNRPIIEREFELKPEYALTQNLLYIDDSLLIGNLGVDAYEKGRLKSLNPISDKEYLSDLFPTVENEQLLELYDLYILYFSALRYNKSNEKLVSALNSFNRIDIFNLDMSLEYSIVEGESFDGLNAVDHKKQGTVIEGLESYYRDLFCSDNYIYALFKGNKNSEIATEIRIFTWDYKPLYKLNISEDLISFSIDEINGLIYGVDYSNEKIMRYEFDIL